MKKRKWPIFISSYVAIGLVFALAGNLRVKRESSIFANASSANAWFYNVVMPALTWPMGVVMIVNIALERSHTPARN